MDGMVIIGAGECGTRAAFALRENGWAGPITLIGQEAGLPYERPPLSKPEQDGARRKPICGGAAMTEAAIDYRDGIAVLGIDPEAHLLRLGDGSTLGYQRLLLATGAQPRRLNCAGADLALDFRTHADAERIFAGVSPGEPVAIIGAGLIGMELAAVLRGKGAPVTVIEAGPAPLGRAVPPHLAARILQRHRDEGVSFHFGASIAGIEPGGVKMADGALIPAALIVSAIGILPDTALAEAAGLVTGNGILTDGHLQTSDPDIFAAGDCAALTSADGRHVRLESWRNARDQAETAARNMIGTGAAHVVRPWFWSDQYDLGLQIAGLPLPEHHMVARQMPDGAELAFYLQDGALVATAGLGHGNSIAKEIKLAEMLIGAGLRPDPAALSDPSVNLKILLKSARAA